MLSCLAYADDIVLLATSQGDMQILLDECNKLATEHMFYCGYDKMKCAVFAPTEGCPPLVLSLSSMDGCNNTELDPNKARSENCSTKA